jgi:hypothetical protein
MAFQLFSDVALADAVEALPEIEYKVKKRPKINPRDPPSR